MQQSSSKTFLVVVAIISALLFAGCKSKQASGPAGGEPSGQGASPSTPGDSPQVSFLKQHGLDGRVALIEFGLIGCELSGQGLDRMIRLRRTKAIPRLSYARVEAAKDKGAVEEYYKAKSPGFAVSHDANGSLARAFDATVYPCFLLVDKFRRVRYRGKFPDERLEEWVEALQAEKSDPGPDVPLFGAVKLDGPKLLASTKLPSLDGTVKSLRGCMGPGGLVVVFVDTTCPFSASAMGQLPTVAAVMAKQKVPSVLVNLDDAEADVRSFFRKRKPGAPVLYDVTTGTKLKWNIQSVPTVVFIDAGGQIAYNGKAVWARLGTAAEEALGLSKGSLAFSAKGTEYG